jgi:hypothetical protein
MAKIQSMAEESWRNERLGENGAASNEMKGALA